MGKLGGGGKVGGATARGVDWVSSEGCGMDGPGSLWFVMFLVRLTRNLGNARASVGVDDDELGIGPLPTSPPSIFRF